MEVVSLELKSLDGFHVWAVRPMAGKVPTQNLDGTWKYPSLKDVLKAVGLWMIDHYIGVCWETIACFIVDQPLFALCRDGERKRGSMHCKILVGAANVNQHCGVTTGRQRGHG